MEKTFQPLLLGSDINVYGMARAFHEHYGITSLAFAVAQLAPTRFSSIVDVRLVENFTQRDVFVRTLITFARVHYQAHPHTRLLLISCGDVYSFLLAQVEDELRPYYSFHALPLDMADRLSSKTTFYETCAEYGLPHPATFVVTKENAREGAYRELPFPFPVALKPADSREYLKIEFEGRKKAYIIDTLDELEWTINAIYNAGYTGELIVQDFIPGDDSRMRVLNAYVDQHHRVRMMFLGHPLLEDPTPAAVGNYAAIMPDYNEEICTQIGDFLQQIGYVGVANFDMKYDERDGKYKLFEINLRQGRSSYFVTLNGFNLGAYFVDDLIYDTDFDGNTLIGRGDKLWMQVPVDIVKRYVAAGSDKDAALALIKRGQWGTTLRYKPDLSLKRRVLLAHMFNVYRKGYKEYFVWK